MEGDETRRAEGKTRGMEERRGEETKRRLERKQGGRRGGSK